MYDFDNPDLPTLQPWRLTNAPPATRFVFERNPYFHRVDPEGQQLPYIDEVRVRRGRRPADPDQDRRRRDRPAVARPVLQALHLPQGERGAQRAARRICGAPRRARIWRSTRISTPRTRCGASCSATCASAARSRSASIATRSIRSCITGSAWAATTRCCRRARSISPNTAIPGRTYDPEQANALLDEIGLTERSADGLRLLPDGRPMELVVETAGEETRAVRHPRAGGRGLAQSRHQDPCPALAAGGVPQPDLLRRGPDVDLVRARERHPDSGHEPGGVRADQPAAAAVAQMGPAPRDQGPGRRGAGPRRRRTSCSSCSTRGGRRAATRSGARSGTKMLAIYSDQVYSIGLISGIMQPVAARHDAAQPAGRGGVQLGARCAVRHLSARYFLVRRAGRAGRADGRLSLTLPSRSRRAA